MLVINFYIKIARLFVYPLDSNHVIQFNNMTIIIQKF